MSPKQMSLTYGAGIKFMEDEMDSKREKLFQEIENIAEDNRIDFPAISSTLYALLGSMAINDEYDFNKWCMFYVDKQLEKIDGKRLQSQTLQ